MVVLYTNFVSTIYYVLVSISVLESTDLLAIDGGEILPQVLPQVLDIYNSVAGKYDSEAMRGVVVLVILFMNATRSKAT